MPTTTAPEVTMNTVHFAGMKIGHVRGVQDLPVRTSGNPEEDRATVEAEVLTAARRVLPQVQPNRLRVAWRPSGRTADVWLTLAIKTNGSSRYKVATFSVRGVA